MITLLNVLIINRAERFALALTTMTRAGVNLKALSLSPAGIQGGEIQILASDVGKAFAVLTEAGFKARRQEAVAIEVKDEVGGLDRIIGELVTVGLAPISFFCSVTRRADTALALAVFHDNAAAEKVLREAGFNLVDRASIQTDEMPVTKNPSLDDYLGGSFFW
jgi:hypothetical protein